MVKMADLRNLWTVLLISPLGRRFPRLVGASYKCLFLGVFDGCPLLVDYELREIRFSDADIASAVPVCVDADEAARR